LTFKYIAAANDEENISSCETQKEQDYKKISANIEVEIVSERRRRANLRNGNSQGLELLSVLRTRLPGIVGDENDLLALGAKHLESLRNALDEFIALPNHT